MNEVTISTEEYKDLIKAKVEYDQLRNLLETKFAENDFLYSGDVAVISLLFGIEVKKDA